MNSNKCIVSASPYSIQNLLCDYDKDIILAPILGPTKSHYKTSATIPFIKLPKPNFYNNENDNQVVIAKNNLPPLHKVYKRDNNIYHSNQTDSLKTHCAWNNDPIDDDYLKIKRKRATVKQTQALQKAFEMTAFPSTILRENLARYLGMSPRTVQVWFQNKRQSVRKIQFK